MDKKFVMADYPYLSSKHPIVRGKAQHEVKEATQITFLFLYVGLWLEGSLDEKEQEDKNLRCGLGGFAVKKMATCNLWSDASF